MKGRKPEKDEQKHLDIVRELGCIVCRSFGASSPGVPHHLHGKTQKGAHFDVINLCQNHHQTKCSGDVKYWVSRHGDGKRLFEQTYGTEEELLSLTNELINYR